MGLRNVRVEGAPQTALMTLVQRSHSKMCCSRASQSSRGQDSEGHMGMFGDGSVHVGAAASRM